MKVGYRFFGDAENALAEHAVIGALSAAGLNPYLLDIAKLEGPGILLFDEVSAEVYNFVREFSRNGLERVIAIASRSSALRDGITWALMRAGASDVFAWEHSSNPAQEVAVRFKRWQEIDRIVAATLIKENLVGESAVWKCLLRRIVEVARFSDSSVLLLGESGTGKELLARLIHTLDSRRDKSELIIVDCTTVVPELSGSEFFGHERGSYTGATSEREGAFGLADKGTLFLDEVGELNPRLQSELLRVVQEHTYKRVGSNSWKKTNFRLICATNRNLHDEEAQGRFRRDFFHRIAGWTCVLPPLRERLDDVLHLVNHFIRRLQPDENPPSMDQAVHDYLLTRDYPGNVRELKALVERMIKRHVGPGPITVGDIAEEERPDLGASPDQWHAVQFENTIRRAISLGVSLKEIGNAATETAIRLAVIDEAGNLQRAAQKLGVTDRALQMRRAQRREESKLLRVWPGNGDGK
jgi:transcriptional regulator with GAF, ATPase, and Fis domain